jgi:hypothetical protein
MSAGKPIVIAITLAANPDGTLRTTNQFGDYNPAPATLSVNQPALVAFLGSFVGLQTGGTAISKDLRGAWLTGSQAATCTFAIRTITGDAVTGKNWTVTGSVLAQSLVTGSIGSGTFELQAIDSGGNVLSLGQYSWSIQAATVTTDVLPPTIPTNLQVTGGTGVLNCTIDAANDRVDNAIVPSGMKQYDVYLDGVFNQSVPATQGPSGAFTVTNIGGISSPAAPTFSSSAGTATLTAAGTGIHGVTADQCLFDNQPLAGDATLIVKLNPFTSAYQYSTSGIMVRESLDPSSVFTAIYVQPSSPGNGFQTKSRMITGGVSANNASASGFTGGWVKIQRVGSTITTSYSTDGNHFVPMATLTLAMASTAYWGTFLSSQNPGVACTSTISEINLNQVAPVSFSITTTGTHNVSVRSVDNNNNASAQCAVVQGSVGASQQTGSIVFNYGGYLYTDRNDGFDAQIARLPALTGHPGFIGSQMISFWSAWENPNVPGDYTGNWAPAGTAGFQLMDKILAAHAKLGLQFMWHVSGSYGFAGNNRAAVFDSSVCPTYLGQSTYGANNDVENTGFCGAEWINTKTMTTKYGSGVKCYVRFWDPNVMTRLLAMAAAYGARYDNPNPALNAPNSDRLEMVSFIGESTIPTFTGYSDAAAFAQYQRYIPGMRQCFPRKQLRFWGNYFSDSSYAKKIIDLMAQYAWCGGGPDCVNETDPSGRNKTRVFPFNLAWRGINPATNQPDPTYVNYAGKLPWISEFEPDEEGPRSGGLGAPALGNGNWQDYINLSANLQHANYNTLFDNGYTGDNKYRLKGFDSSQPTHPNAIDWFDSLWSGQTVNGATAGTSMQFASTRPSLLS